MSYFLFHKLRLGPLLATLFSLQLADGSVMQPIGKFGNMPVNIGDIWVLEADDAQIILGQPILATAGCHIDVREGWASFEMEGQFAVSSHRKKDMVSPHSSILDVLPISPEIDMKDVWNCEDPLNSD